MATNVQDYIKQNPQYVGRANISNRSTESAPSESKKPRQSGLAGFLTSLISEGGAIGGGLKGAALGSAGGPIGTLLGGAVGAGLGGFLGRSAENKIRDDEFRVGDALKEGATSAVFGAGPIRTGKAVFAATTAGKGLAKEAAEKAIVAPGMLSRIIGKTGNVATKVKDDLTDRATTSFLKLTPAQTKRMLDEGVDPSNLAKIAARYGKDAESIIGRTGSKGELQSTIKALESGIEKTASTAGRNVRIDGADIIKSLKAERKLISKELGGSARLGQMDKIIADAERKYAKGVTVKQAREILREANQRFGSSILDDTGDAVARAAQKLEGNVMRKALKDRFPTIAKALDDEKDLIQLREILKSTRAKDITGGFKTGKFEITRPGTAVDSLLNSKKVSRGILNRGTTEEAGQEIADAFALKPLGVTSRVLTGKSLVGGEMEAPADEMGMESIDGLEPTPEDLMSAPEMTPDEYDPFAPENLKSSIQQILSQGGKMKDVSEFLSTAKIINELTGAEEEKVKPLNATQRKEKNNAESALKDIQGIRRAISEDSSSAFKAGLPGGSLTQRVTGSSDFAASQKNVVDAIARLRSGAAITEDEAKRYLALLPGRFDSPDDANLKLDRLEELLYSFTYPEGGAEADLSSLGL